MSLSFFYSSYHLADACQFIFLLLSVPRLAFPAPPLICCSCQARKAEQPCALSSPTGGILLRTASLLLHLFLLTSSLGRARTVRCRCCQKTTTHTHTHVDLTHLFIFRTHSNGAHRGIFLLPCPYPRFLVLN